MAFNKHSDEWKEVEAFINTEREGAIEALIADHQSERQRGIIDLLDRLAELPGDSQDEKVANPSY